MDLNNPINHRKGAKDAECRKVKAEQINNLDLVALAHASQPEGVFRKQFIRRLLYDLRAFAPLR